KEPCFFLLVVVRVRTASLSCGPAVANWTNQVVGVLLCVVRAVGAETGGSVWQRREVERTICAGSSRAPHSSSSSSSSSSYTATHLNNIQQLSHVEPRRRPRPPRRRRRLHSRPRPRAEQGGSSAGQQPSGDHQGDRRPVRPRGEGQARARQAQRDTTGSGGGAGAAAASSDGLRAGGAKSPTRSATKPATAKSPAKSPSKGKGAACKSPPRSTKAAARGGGQQGAQAMDLEVEA
ncbi:unnamed protein product, partial [Ectocarpus fasciculatus]